jgi:uncharacterized membrane protein YccC
LTMERYFKWPTGYWVPITVMVVMSAQTHFGGALRKAEMRFLGTIAGATTTVLALTLFGSSSPVVFITVFCACIAFTYLASSKGDISYAGTLGGVTVILTLAGQQANIKNAIERGLLIVVGIVIALVVSRLIFPIHARERFRYHVAEALRNLRTLYFKTVQLHNKPASDTLDATIDDNLTDNFSDQPRLIAEACAGSRAFAVKKEFFVEILRNERRLNRLINLMYRSISEIETPDMIRKQLAEIEDLHVLIEERLAELANCFETMTLPENAVNFDQALTKLTQLVEKLPKKQEPGNLMAEHSFLFFIEQIIKEIAHLEQLIIKVNIKNPMAKNQ